MKNKSTDCLGQIDSSVESSIILASLLRPNDQLFWVDEEGWNLYYAEIGAEEIRLPTSG